MLSNALSRYVKSLSVIIEAFEIIAEKTNIPQGEIYVKGERKYNIFVVYASHSAVERVTFYDESRPARRAIRGLSVFVKHNGAAALRAYKSVSKCSLC